MTKPKQTTRTTRKPRAKAPAKKQPAKTKAAKPAAPARKKTAAEVVEQITKEAPQKNPNHNGSKKVLPEVEFNPAWVECPQCHKRLVDTTNIHSRRDFQAGIIRYHTCPHCDRGFRSRYMGMV